MKHISSELLDKSWWCNCSINLCVRVLPMAHPIKISTSSAGSSPVSLWEYFCYLLSPLSAFGIVSFYLWKNLFSRWRFVFHRTRRLEAPQWAVRDGGVWKEQCAFSISWPLVSINQLKKSQKYLNPYICLVFLPMPLCFNHHVVEGTYRISRLIVISCEKREYHDATIIAVSSQLADS